MALKNRKTNQNKNGSDEKANGEGSSADSGIYNVEKILKKRVRNGEAQYLIKWEGYANKHNTWEPERNLNLPENTNSSPKPSTSTSNVRPLSPVYEPKIYRRKKHGFARGLKAERILNVNMVADALAFSIQFEGSSDIELILSPVVHANCPDLVIQFYESLISWYDDEESDD